MNDVFYDLYEDLDPDPIQEVADDIAQDAKIAMYQNTNSCDLGPTNSLHTMTVISNHSIRTPRRALHTRQATA